MQAARGGTASISGRELGAPRPQVHLLRRCSLRSAFRRSAPTVSAFTPNAYAPIPARVKNSRDGEETEEQEMERPIWGTQTESPVDDHRLRNPLLRQERMSTGWFGCILEYEGVLVQDTHEAHVEAWKQVAQEFDLRRPLGHTFRRIKGVRDDVIVRRVFNWTHNPGMARQLAQRKAEIYDSLLGGRQPAEMLEARPFLQMLKKYNIPIGLACAVPSERVHAGLQRMGLSNHFSTVVTAEDSGAQEVEYIYSFASQGIQRPPIRCVVVGESNTSVEAAHELGMKCIVVTGNKPVYDFASADLVVRDLSQINMFNMKRLFSNEDLVQSRLVEEMEEEEDPDEESLDAQLAELDSGFDDSDADNSKESMLAMH